MTGRRTIPGFAARMEYLCDETAPEASVIRAVLDDLNTRTIGPLFATYPPEEARRLRRRPGSHHTPKRAGRLDMAEMGRSVLPRQCLARRPPEEGRLASEVKAWEGERGRIGVRLEWSFRVADARRKLAHLYPQDPQR